MTLTTQLYLGGGEIGRQPAPGAGDDAVRGHSSSLRIVICDDDKDTVNTLAAILEDEGHKVERVYRGQDAMHVVRRFEPQVVICDIAMPKVTGYDVVRAIREQFSTYRPMVIAISGVYVKPVEAFLSRAAGFDHHLMKPVHPGLVLRLLAEFSSTLR